MTVDVFEYHDRRVHDHSDGKGHCPHGHEVEGLPLHVHQGECEKEGEGNGDADDDGRTGVVQEDEQDHYGQQGPEQGRGPDRTQGELYIFAFIGDDVEGDDRVVLPFYSLKDGLDPFEHSGGIGTILPVYVDEQDIVPSVDGVGIGVGFNDGHVGNILQPHVGVVPESDDHVLDFVEA